MTTTFETAKVGDRVWCVRSGWGEIRGTESSLRYPIYVCFPNDEFKTYTLGGFYVYDDISQTLFWDEVVIEAPEKPMPDLDVDTKVLVWDDRFEVRYKRYFSHFHSGKIYVFSRGSTSWNSEDTMVFDNWELAE